MIHRLSTRIAAFGMASMLTLAMLGSVDELATQKPAPGTMARAELRVAPTL